MSFRQKKSQGDVRSSLSVDSTETRRHSGTFLEQQQNRSSQDSPTMDGKRSPYPRGNKSQEVSSSQESLSSPSQQRANSRASSNDLRESDEGDGHQSSPSHRSANGSRSGSPDKPINTFETPRNAARAAFFELGGGDRGGVTELGGDGHLAPGDAAKRAFGFDVTEMNPARGTRERSFEKSLDNILDKCSEKSLDLNLSVDSWNSSVQEAGRSPDLASTGTSGKSSKSEKKKNKWYNIMSTSYKSRSEDFRKMFKDVPKDERLLVDYSCALQKDILVQGRMYISQNYICFYAKIFNWETMLMIPCKDIKAITKEKTARVIPNAIQITTEKDRYFLTSFGARDKTYMMLFRIWQNALLNQPMPPKEMWSWIHYNYGDDLGLTSSDDDYVTPQGFEDLTERLKEELPILKEPAGTDSEAPMNTTEGASITAGDNEDTDALVSDEVFNNSSTLQNPATLAIPSSAKTDLHTDFLDSTDDSEGEFFCAGQDHLEKLYLDEVFNINIDTVFECLFTDSAFFRAFVGSRKTFDLNLPPWEEELDENGNKIRNISYTLTLNHSIGPKTSPSTEKQICYAMSRPGRIYHVDCECCNGGIPYSDSFYVVLRYCLTRVSQIRCRVVVTGELKYKKHVIGMFRGMIEKSAVNGLTDYVRQLSVHLRRECERQEAIVTGHQTITTTVKKKVRRRRVKGHPNLSDSAAPPRPLYSERQVSTPPSPSRNLHREERLIELNAHTLVRIIIVVLVLLLLFNAVLFYKLWSLESYASSLYGIPSQESLENLAKYPRTQEEWSQLLQQQKNLHEREIAKWEEVLSASIHIVEQMKKSLVDLQATLRMGSHHNEES